MSEAAGPQQLEVVTREDFSEVTFLLEIHQPLMAKAARPGQFVIVMSHEHGERIPLTIADFDTKRGTITLVIQAVGKTTKEMQHLGGAKKMAFVGGGLGVAPIYPQARAAKQSGAYVIGVLGFRTRDLVFWEKKFRDCCDELVICTDDGSAGIKGSVTAGIAKVVEAHKDIDEVVAIGPPIMMKASAEATRPHKIKTMVSLNPIMVDGTGMCGGCRVKVGDRVKFACVDGPDFDGHEVDFDDLMGRLKRFAADEKAALERWSDTCRMTRPQELELPDVFEETQGG
jgi:NAD(P)H-flavin reductase